MGIRARLAAMAVAIFSAGPALAAPSGDDYGIGAFTAHKAEAGLKSAGTAEVDGVKLYYETYGAGPPVLVLHGGTGVLETMHRQIVALAGDHLVVAPDSRAHGRSGDVAGPLHYHQMAEDMVALMDHLKIARADVVGWSDGGIIGLDLALHHPDRVRRVVAIGANFNLQGLSNPDQPPPPPDAPSFAPQRIAYQRMSPTPQAWPEFYAKVQAMWRSEPNYSEDDLRRIHTPVLVMAGESDSIRREHTDAMARAIPGAREVIIPGATHFGPLTHFEAVNAPIVAFLREP